MTWCFAFDACAPKWRRRNRVSIGELMTSAWPQGEATHEIMSGRRNIFWWYAARVQRRLKQAGVVSAA